MASPHQLRWSDIWLLVAIYFCSLRGQRRLRNVIAAADAINHAVINFEELSSGLVRLVGNGLILVEQNPWCATCTQKGRDTVEPVAKKHPLAFRVWQEVEKALGVQPWVPGEPLPHQTNSLRYPDFSKEDYEKEVGGYLKMMRLKTMRMKK